MEDENVVADNSNTAEEEVLETSNEESGNELETRLAKAEELANNYKIRAEKAERIAKLAKGGESEAKVILKPVAGELTTKDLYALIDAKVPEDDIEEVREYAQLKKISIAEALKSNVVKTILGDKAEQRKTAEGTNTNGGRRSSAKLSDDRRPLFHRSKQC